MFVQLRVERATAFFESTTAATFTQKMTGGCSNALTSTASERDPHSVFE